jgi:hypothetical protein
LVCCALADEDVIDGTPGVVALETETGGGVGLGIAIDQENLQALEGEACSQIDGRGGFAHTSLLIDESDDLAHGIQE